MKRLALILAASGLVAVSGVKAGELDSEYGTEAKVPTPASSTVARGLTELDSESPTQAFFFRRRFFGYGGFGGFGYGYPGFGFGFYRGFYGYPGFGFGGFGYGRGFGYGGFGRGFGYGRRW